MFVCIIFLKVLNNFHWRNKTSNLHMCILSMIIIQLFTYVYSLQSHGLQHARLPFPSPSRRACSNLCPLSSGCHPVISSSVFPFYSRFQSLPASGSFPVSWLFTSGGQSIGALPSVWVLPVNTQDWFPLGLTGWISLQPKGLSKVFSNTTAQKHQFFRA